MDIIGLLGNKYINSYDAWHLLNYGYTNADDMSSEGNYAIIGKEESDAEVYLTLPVNYARMQFKIVSSGSSIYVRFKWVHNQSWKAWKQIY